MEKKDNCKQYILRRDAGSWGRTIVFTRDAGSWGRTIVFTRDKYNICVLRIGCLSWVGHDIKKLAEFLLTVNQGVHVYNDHTVIVAEDKVYPQDMIWRQDNGHYIHKSVFIKALVHLKWGISHCVLKDILKANPWIMKNKSLYNLIKRNTQ